MKHVSVMTAECLEYFKDARLITFYEGTLGAGGHAKAILEAHPEIEIYIGCDKDPEAIEIAKSVLKKWKDKVVFVHGDFGDLDEHLNDEKIKEVDGFFFDLGVSSMQLDQGEKGFSFMKEGPLDMRMDPTSRLTAREIINRWTEKELGELFRDLGEEPRWRKVAKVIVEARKKMKIETTTQLAAIICSALGGSSKKKLHPATLIFQALRMCVNTELESAERGIKNALKFLAPGGRLGVLSFHRGEDRLVKNIFRDAAKLSGVRLLTKKPRVPTLAEIRANARCRSAKLRFAERV